MDIKLDVDATSVWLSYGDEGMEFCVGEDDVDSIHISYGKPYQYTAVVTINGEGKELVFIVHISNFALCLSPLPPVV